MSDNLNQRLADYNAGWDDCMEHAAAAYSRWIDDLNRRWASYNQDITRRASVPPQDILEEMRGNQERAEAIRKFWQLTGLKPQPQVFTPVDDKLRQRHIARCRASWGRAGQREGAA